MLIEERNGFAQHCIFAFGLGEEEACSALVLLSLCQATPHDDIGAQIELGLSAGRADVDVAGFDQVDAARRWRNLGL